MVGGGRLACLHIFRTSHATSSQMSLLSVKRHESISARWWERAGFSSRSQVSRRGRIYTSCVKFNFYSLILSILILYISILLTKQIIQNDNYVEWREMSIALFKKSHASCSSTFVIWLVNVLQISNYYLIIITSSLLCYQMYAYQARHKFNRQN